ncbi:MAG TPA: hypothetical protein GX522_09620 [Firmicutes bacterium]|jgi:uncharacterized protein YfkK (UPF0435 family)|nr:hypothetical protein [Bacillota bacterium]
MDLSLELERVKLQIQASFERLAKEGKISEDDLNDVYKLVEEMDNISEDEFQSRLSDLKKRFGLDDM